MRLSTALLLIATLVAACGLPQETLGRTLNVGLTENRILPDRSALASGDVTITIVNKGAITHSLDLIKTDLRHDMLPPDPKDASRVQLTDVVKNIGKIAPGGSTSFTVAMAPGAYVLLCSQPAHYLIGLHVPLTVR